MELAGELDFPPGYRTGSLKTVRSTKPLIELVGQRDIGAALNLLSLVALSEPMLYLCCWKTTPATAGGAMPAGRSEVADIAAPQVHL